MWELDGIQGWIAGVDEAGRGALAGPVVAAAVILNPESPVPGVRDSKQLSAAARDELAAGIRHHALAWAVGTAEPHEIDRINILRASFVAMQRAVEALDVRPECVQVDGDQAPYLSCPAVAIVDGDARVDVIGAASIIAKVHRDGIMGELDRQYPGYGFAEHKGYGTAAHLAALRGRGLSPVHRRSFEPVREVDCRQFAGPAQLPLDWGGE